MERKTKKRISAADVVDADPITLGRNGVLLAVSVYPAVFANIAGLTKTSHGLASSKLRLWAGRSAVDRRLGKFHSLVCDAPTGGGPGFKSRPVHHSQLQ